MFRLQTWFFPEIKLSWWTSVRNGWTFSSEKKTVGSALKFPSLVLKFLRGYGEFLSVSFTEDLIFPFTTSRLELHIYLFKCELDYNLSRPSAECRNTLLADL